MNVFGHGTTVLPPAAVSWPVQVGAIPPLADCFQDRSEAVKLAAAVGSGGTAAHTQVLSGLGGVGKSQLAASYARASAERTDLLVWVNATTRDAVVAAYAQAAAQLGHPATGKAEQAADWFRGWMQTAQRDWMVVLDDVTDPAHLQGLWPDGSRGRTVVTTRRADAALSGAGRRRMEVGLYSPEQSRAYLVEKLGGEAGAARLVEVDELATDLGFLPLALAQAAAFIADRGDTCAGYRHRLADRRQMLAELFPPDALADDYRATVAATWSISVQAADQLAPVGLSRPLLELASMLAPNGFPIELIETAAAVRYIHPAPPRERWGRWRSLKRSQRDLSRLAAPGMCREALHNLARLSLIGIEDSEGLTRIRVHGLVQRAAAEQLELAKAREVAWVAGDALLEVWPDIERDTQLGQMLRANVGALSDRAGPALWEPEAHPVLWRTGRSLSEWGLLDAAVSHWTEVTRAATHKLGVDHPDTFNSRDNLAASRGEGGNPAAAVAAFEDLLDDALRVFGPNHHNTLVTRGGLARWRGYAGDAVGAATALDRVLEDFLRVLGPDHPDTLTARHSAAYWRGEAGDPAAAAAAFEQLLTHRLRVLGPDHPDTLSARHNVATWRGYAGDPAGASAAFGHLLTDFLRVLGPSDPRTLTARDGVARWRGMAGDPIGAATAYEQLLTDRLRVLGPDHPDTLATRHNLAHWQRRAGDPAATATTHEQLLADSLRVLGPDHPDTLSTRNELARWQGEAGDPAGAASAYEQLLADRLRVLGPDHPDTLATRHNLAHWRRRAGDPAAAAAAYELLLADRLRVLGPDHPDTLATRSNLANWRGEAGDLTGAATAHEQLLTDSLRILGPDHPGTLATRNNLAYWGERAAADA